MADDKGEWCQFPEAGKYIRQAVDQWHPHLQRATILAVARPEANRSGGKLVWGKFKVASPMERALYGDPDLAYLMILPRDIWLMLTDKGRLALVDHELSHAGGFDSEAEKWTLVGHDVEEFIAVIQRHGLWKSDVAHFIEQTKDAQMTIEAMLRTAVAATTEKT